MADSQEIIEGRYRIVRKLGEGSFGSVHLAEDLRILSRRVVIKIARAGDEFGPSALRRMQREAGGQSRLQHPGIVSLLDTGVTSDGRMFLVIEWVDGFSLRDLLAKGPLSLPDALDVFRAVAAALAAAHDQGIIHRDIKPSNVLVPKGEGGGPAFERVKLTDFGAVGKLGLSSGTTRSGQVFGTPYYMAPEQALGKPQSPATDVYGLGVLLYEMIYGRTPFAGGNVADTFRAILSEAAALPDTVPLPPHLRSLLLRCLDKDENARPPTAAEVLRELERGDAARGLRFEASPLQILASPGDYYDSPDTFLADSPHTTLQPAPPTAARSAGARLSVEAGEPSSYTAPQSSPALAPQASRRGVGIMLIGAGLVLVAVLAVVFLAVMRFSRAPAPPRELPQPTGTPELPQQPVGTPEPPQPVSAPQVAPPVRSPGLARPAFGIVLGLALAVGGVLLSRAVRRWLAGRQSQIERDATGILFGSKSREVLTATLAMQVDEIVTRVRRLDEKILASSIMIMITEYETAKESHDRQAALMNTIQLLEKLTFRLSPWYVHHERLVAFLVALVGVASGVASIVASVVQVSAVTR